MPPAPVKVVLVVDDNAAFRDIATRVLASWGHTVAEADSIATARQRVHEAHPDVALVDIGLPDGDGFGLARQLLSLPWPLRVILVSTDDAAGNRFAAQRVGASAFFPKDELLSEDLRRVIERG